MTRKFVAKWVKSRTKIVTQFHFKRGFDSSFDWQFIFTHVNDWHTSVTLLSCCNERFDSWKIRTNKMEKRAKNDRCDGNSTNLARRRRSQFGRPSMAQSCGFTCTTIIETTIGQKKKCVCFVENVFRRP